MIGVSALAGLLARGLGRWDRWAERLLDIDEVAMDWMSRHPMLRKLDVLWVAATYLGDGYIWGLLALYLIAFGGRVDRMNVLVTLGVLMVAISVFRMFKLFFSRPRPALEGRPSRGWYLDSYAFPSGHTTVAFCVAYCVGTLYPTTTVVATVYGLAGIIGISRIYLRDHYPLDVIGGALLGSLIAHTVLPLFGFIINQARW